MERYRGKNAVPQTFICTGTSTSGGKMTLSCVSAKSVDQIPHQLNALRVTQDAVPLGKQPAGFPFTLDGIDEATLDLIRQEVALLTPLYQGVNPNRRAVVQNSHSHRRCHRIRHRDCKVKTECLPINCQITLEVNTAGDENAPAIIFVHGFPESADHYNQQLLALAKEGFYAIAYNRRGVGKSTRKHNLSFYSIQNEMQDALDLLVKLGLNNAVFVGMDTGWSVVNDLARLHPSKVNAVISQFPFVDFLGPVIPIYQYIFGVLPSILCLNPAPRYNYVLEFNNPANIGATEDALEDDEALTIKTFLWVVAASGPGAPSLCNGTVDAPGLFFLEVIDQLYGPAPANLSFISNKEIKDLAQIYKQSGFYGALAHYRNIDTNRAYIQSTGIPASNVSMPFYEVTGAADFANGFIYTTASIGGYPVNATAGLSDYRGQTFIPGAGHWVSLEQPVLFSNRILEILSDLGY
jgi:pimeloyl-ACP methyl ester carboxylesterase